MKRVLYKWLAAGVMILSIASCKKQMDEVKPTDSIDESNVFQNIEDLQRGLNAVYGRYLAKGHMYYLSALLSDEARYGRDNSGQGRFTYSWTFGSDQTSAGDIAAFWGDMPRVIDQANRVLQKADEVTARDAFEESRRPIIKGQALAMRGMAMLDMLTVFTKPYDPADPLGIPYPTTPVGLGKYSRLTVAQSVQAIQADLEQARTLLPATSSANFSDTVMNTISVAAVQARLALHMRDWQKASDYANEVINSGIKPLVAGAAFTNIWVDANDNEILFKIRQETPASTFVASLFTSGNLVYFAPSDKLVAAYGAGDIRKNAYIGEDVVGSGGSTRYVKKHFKNGQYDRVVHLKAIRTAEMWLIRAEARAELGDLPGANADLNELRSKRISGYTPVNITNKQTLIDEIMNERFKELAFEGFRFFDLKRRNLPVERLLSDVDNNPTFQTLPAGNFRFTLPIPLQELLANPQMAQNPGY